MTTNLYSGLITNIGGILEQGRKQVITSVNTVLLRTYWQIGREIVEYEQKGKEKAEYGSKLLERLSKDLRFRYGKGFSRSNIIYMRLLFIKYPIFQALPGKSKKSQISQALPDQLTWTHFVSLLSVSDDNARSFYEKQCISENWSTRELQRQIASALYTRLLLSKDKKGLIELSKKGQIIEKPKDIIKDPYILEFLKIPENYKYSEKELETKLINKLQSFLLELGKGFTFVKRQYRITLDNTDYYIDLVFYHRILKCFILIDLKMDKANHTDIGQMNMYLNYFKKEENSKEDNSPIGIILSADKNDLLVEFALGGITNNLFVSKYKLYLPTKKELKEIIE
jgi:predicted nuclease of restriction endonuclease-like (RecB) superfamily